MKKYIGLKKKKKYKLFLIKLVLPSQGAKVVPPMGPQIAQTGVSALEFCEKFNDRSEELDIEPGTLISVLLFITPLKKFFIELKMPLTTYLLRYGLGLEGKFDFTKTVDTTNLFSISFYNKLLKKINRMYNNFFFKKLKKHKSYNKKLVFLKQFYFFYKLKNIKNKIINSKLKYIKKLCLNMINRLFLKNNFIKFFNNNDSIKKFLKNIEISKNKGVKFKETRKRERLVLKNRIYSLFFVSLRKYVCKLEDKYKFISYVKNNNISNDQQIRDPINNKNLLYYYRGKVRDIMSINPLFSRKLRVLIILWEVTVVKASFMEKYENFFCNTFSSFFYITIVQNYRNFLTDTTEDEEKVEMTLEHRYKKNRKRNVSK